MLSAIVITFNEAEKIEKCLKSLKFCDEIVVVDSGSTDHTLDIAARYTQRIFIEQWKGFGLQKQSALEKAAGEWVLSIDADEEVPEPLAEEIIGSVKSNLYSGFMIPRKNLYGSKWLRHGGQYPDHVLRLFKREAGRFTDSVVHERVVVEGRVGKLSNPIVHHAFEDLSSMLEKMNRYSSLGAEQMLKNGKKANSFSPFIHAMALFLKDYIFRGGFLDGREGFNVALLKSLGVYFKYQKLLDLMRNNKSAKGSF